MVRMLLHHRRRTSGLRVHALVLHQHNAEDDQRNANEARNRYGMLREAERAEMIHHDGGGHLSRDHQRQQRRCAQRGQQQDDQQNEDAAQYAAAPGSPRRCRYQFP